MKRTVPVFLVLLLLQCVSLSLAGENPRVDFFSPRGLVKGARQVTARFSEPITSFGDPGMESPFLVDCPAKGSGRWADVNNWVFDFERDLPAGIACTFTLKEGLKTPAGTLIGGERVFSFTTGGPAVATSAPDPGDTVDEEQVFVLTLDGEVDPSTILAHVRFSVEGIAEPLGVRILTGEERAAALKAARRPDNGKTVALRCRARFPNNASVKLIWGAGVASPGGIASSADQVLTFTVRTEFTVSFQCERTNANAPCVPMTPMKLKFSDPVPAGLASKIVMRSPSKSYRPKLVGNDEEGEGAEEGGEGYLRSVVFKGPFPPMHSFVIELPKGFTDDAGRAPANRADYPLQVRTDSYPPLAKFAAPFGIVELTPDSAIPITLRNVEAKVKARQYDPDRIGEPDARQSAAKKTGAALGDQSATKAGHAETIKGRQHAIPVDREEKIIEWLRRVRAAKRIRPILKGVGEVFSIPKPNGAKAFEVVGIPIKKPGLHVVEVESPILGAALLGAQRPMYVSSAVLVTNLSAHLKWGRESSLVWVTSLDKGLPVSGAEVHLRDCQGKLYWQGKTDSDGIARIRKNIPEKLPYCSDNRQDREEDDDFVTDNDQAMRGMSGGLFAFARKGDDLTFVHSHWDRGIESWRFNLPTEEAKEQTFAHTVFDRTLVRAGDTVHMKHFIRQHVVKGLGLRNVKDLPQTALVKHRGSGQRYEFPLAWRGDGTAETTMTLPKGATLGFYDVYLVRKATPPKESRRHRDGEYDSLDGWESGYFRVEEFRVPLMKAIIEPPKQPAVNAASVEVDLYLSHLSGGGAGGAPVRLRTQVKPRPVSFDDFEGFTFANGQVETGVVKEDYNAGTYGDEEDDNAPKKKQQKESYRTRDLVLDKSGALRATVDGLPKITEPNQLLAELEYRDPNGEIETVTGRIPLWPSQLLVGIKPDASSPSADSFNFKAAVVDLKGKPVAGTKVEVDLFSRRIFTHRKRLVGGFYSYEHVTETKAIGSICKGTTDRSGLLECHTKAHHSGNLVLQATAADAEGNRSIANTDVWVVGEEDWWFEAGDSDRIDLLPERRSYDPGEVAKFQVRSPLRAATVLVTVEREGVIDAYVKKIAAKEKVVAVPVKGNYAPNVFVSALCVRGRVAGTKPTALFDPGKPSYRLGIDEIRVGRTAHELKVKVTADRDTYKVRGKARIRIKVTRADGGRLPKGAEAAVAAVDEGLLELMPNNSWNLLDAMMGRRGYEVRTSTAQTQVVGRRHFGLKALPAGGGGGVRSTRELFDTLLAWKGRVKLDAEGEAEIDIPLNDSLTSFAIVAVADAGTGLFGTGRTTIRTTQDLMILSGLPPLVRQGDRFTARFTVRNPSGREMTVTAAARPSWTGSGFNPVTLKLSPGEAREVSWPAEVPGGIDSATWVAEAKEENGAGRDSIKVRQRVAAAVPVQVQQATLLRVDRPIEMDLHPPQGALPGRGGIEVAVRPKLTQGMGGVAAYMKGYPYSCMEQTVSRAIALHDDALWKQIVATLPAHLDANGLVKYFPSSWLDGSVSLTSYMLSITAEAGRELPPNLVKQMEKGLISFVEGKLRRDSPFPTADLSIQKLSAIEALSRRGKATAKDLSSIAVQPNYWPTSALLDWLSILKRTPDIPNRAKLAEEAEQILRSRLNFQGTVMSFSTDRSDRLWWLMVSTDTNALRTILSFMDNERWRQDMPRLVRGAVARQRRGVWETTIANAWGTVAMDRFSAAFEAAPVTGTTRVEAEGKVKSVVWGEDQKGADVSLPWPGKKGKLALAHSGGGKPWATVLSLAAVPRKEPISSGYRIKKSLTAVEQRNKGRWSRGDIARVRLEIEVQSDMTWVAVNDPVPAGTAILGSGLGRDSSLAARESGKWSRPVYEERAQEAYRAYYEYLPKGKAVVEYSVRFNNEGSFHLPPTRVEALYAPEMFGEIPNPSLRVE